MIRMWKAARQRRRDKIRAYWFYVGRDHALKGLDYQPSRSLTIPWIESAYLMGLKAGKRDLPAHLAALAELNNL